MKIFRSRDFLYKGLFKIKVKATFQDQPFTLYQKSSSRLFWSRWGFFKAQNQDVFAEIFTLIKWFFIFCNFYTPMALFIFTFTKLFFATLFKSRKIKIHKINLKKNLNPLKFVAKLFSLFQNLITTSRFRVLRIKNNFSQSPILFHCPFLSKINLMHSAHTPLTPPPHTPTTPYTLYLTP